MSAKTYRDRTKCPSGHRIVVFRRIGTAGRKVRTYCLTCGKAYQLKAGPLPKAEEQQG